MQGERDIAVGNVVGSNLFNLLAVGFGSLLSPKGVPVSPGALSFDMLVMIGAAVAAIPIFFTRYMIARWEGAVFLGYYIAYTVHLVLDATEHAQLPAYGAAMVGSSSRSRRSPWRCWRSTLTGRSDATHPSRPDAGRASAGGEPRGASSSTRSRVISARPGARSSSRTR